MLHLDPEDYKTTMTTNVPYNAPLPETKIGTSYSAEKLSAKVEKRRADMTWRTHFAVLQHGGSERV